MKKLSVLLGLALTLAGSAAAFADGMPQVVGTTDNAVWTRIVFNDAGSALTSGTLVVWDNDDTEFDRSGYPYVTTTTATDSPWVAGVTLNPSCPDQSLCEIIVHGPAKVQVADSTDALTEDTLVSTSSVAGKAGDYTAAANTCFLGTSMELRNVETGLDSGTDNQVFWVFVQPGCE